MPESSHPILGARFSIAKANSDEYGQEFWQIVWSAIDPTRLFAVSFYEGDTENTLRGTEQVYCIAFRTADAAELEKIAAALQSFGPFRDVAAEPMFVQGEACAVEPLVNAGHMDFAGRFSEDACNPRRALANLKGTSPAFFDDPNWRSRPPFTTLERHVAVRPQKECAVCSHVFSSTHIECPKCGSGVLLSEKKPTMEAASETYISSVPDEQNGSYSLRDWLTYCLAAFPSFRFPGSASFPIAIVAIALGLWALSWYMIYAGTVVTTDFAPGTPSATEITDAPGFLELWRLWWHWSALIPSGILLLLFSYKRWKGAGAEGPLFVKTVKKLTSRLDEDFGEGLADIQALGAEDPIGLRMLEEAMRQRSNHGELQFYVPGPAILDGGMIESSRGRILELAQRQALLEDPSVSGKLISTFATVHSFQDMVDLAHEVRDVGGILQAQAFQLLFNQLRLEAGRKQSTT